MAYINNIYILRPRQINNRGKYFCEHSGRYFNQKKLVFKKDFCQHCRIQSTSSQKVVREGSDACKNYLTRPSGTGGGGWFFS
jgi:hypothetical protein